MINFPNKFRKFKNCNSVFIFTKINDSQYQVINKIKNGERKYVNNVFNYKKIIKKKDLLDFLNCYVYH